MIFNLTSECDPLPPPPFSLSPSFYLPCFCCCCCCFARGLDGEKKSIVLIPLPSLFFYIYIFFNRLFVRSVVPLFLSLSLFFACAYTPRGPKLFLLSSKGPLYYSSALLQFEKRCSSGLFVRLNVSGVVIREVLARTGDPRWWLKDGEIYGNTRLTLHCHHQIDFYSGMDRYESPLSALLILRGRVTTETNGVCNRLNQQHI